MKLTPQKYNFFISLSLIIFILLLMYLCIFFNIHNNNVSLFTVTGKFINFEKEIIPFFSKEKNKYYLFLPSGTKSIIINSYNDILFDDENIKKNDKIDINNIDFKKNYTVSIKNKLGINKKITLVFMKSKNIPSLFIDTESGNMQFVDNDKAHNNTEFAKYSIISDDGKLLNDNEILKIKGRGNATWRDFEKKPYKLILNVPKSLVGLNKSFEFSLKTNSAFNYLTNPIAFWLEKKIGIHYSTDGKFIDLYLNGKYNGNYILCETIKIGSDDISINNLDQDNIKANFGIKSFEHFIDSNEKYKCYLYKQNPNNITGGYLIERDFTKYYEKEDNGVKLSTGDCYTVHSPKKMSRKEAEYLYNYMNDFHSAVMSESGYNNKGKHYTEYINIDSFALKYILEEFLGFYDSAASSAYYYKDKNEKLYTGPGWDFDGTFEYDNKYKISKLKVRKDGTDLYEHLLHHKDFRQKVNENYKYKLKPAINELISYKFDYFKNINDYSAIMDQIRWNRNDYNYSCNKIWDYINTKPTYLDYYFNNITNIKVIRVKDQNPRNLDYFYTNIYKGDLITNDILDKLNIPKNAILKYENGKIFKPNIPIYKDTEISYYITNINYIDKIKNEIKYNIKDVLVFSFFILFIILFCFIIFLYVYKLKRGK